MGSKRFGLFEKRQLGKQSQRIRTALAGAGNYKGYTAEELLDLSRRKYALAVRKTKRLSAELDALKRKGASKKEVQAWKKENQFDLMLTPLVRGNAVVLRHALRKVAQPKSQKR